MRATGYMLAVMAAGSVVAVTTGYASAWVAIHVFGY